MRNKYNKELIQEAVNKSTTWADVCRLLNVTPQTGAQCHLQKRAKEFGVITSHFLGRGHNKGKTFKRRDALEYCFKGSTESSHRIKQRLIRDGYKEDKCEICNISEWNGEKLPLELDHIDSDHYNNELSNLQIICPNCHAIETSKRRSLCGQTGKVA
jgi:Zn finger protein HypA/HybF involved in hydrogenase expression